MDKLKRSYMSCLCFVDKYQRTNFLQRHIEILFHPGDEIAVTIAYENRPTETGKTPLETKKVFLNFFAILLMLRKLQ